MANETNTGWVRLYRSTLNWEWFDDPLTLQLWIVCLLKANHTPTRWQGIEIERGSFVTSVDGLCTATKQTTRQIRTRLARLQASGEISVRATNHKSIITICKFDTYPPTENKNDKRPTNSYGVFPRVPVNKDAKIDEQNDKPEKRINGCYYDDYNQASDESDKPNDNQSTNDRQTQLFSSDNSIRIYKDIKNKNNLSFACAHATETEKEIFFEIFFFKNFINPDYEVERFCANYEASGWIRKNGQQVVDRPALARTWTQEDPKAAPRFNADFLAKYRRLYGLVKQTNPALAPIFIHDLELVFINVERKQMTFRCSRRMAEAIESGIRFFRDNFFDKYFGGWTLRYQTPRI